MNCENPSKEQFRQMLKRYLKNQASQGEKQFIEQWYNAYGSDSRLSLNPEQRQEIENRIWKLIADKRLAISESKPEVSASRNYWRMAGIAASMTILISFLLYYTASYQPSLVKQHTRKKNQAEVTTLINTSTVPKQMTLADGTVIRLQPESSLHVSDIMAGDEREVRLEGEAFFEVAHNPLRPFFVYTGSITTKVLGTSFTVSARKDVVFVEVKTGKVSVTQTTQKSLSPRHTLTEEIILTPNQKAVYDGKQVLMALVEKPRRIFEREAQPLMEFDEQPVAEILTALENAYGVAIEYDRELIKTCILTTSLSDEDLYDRLNIICKAIKGTYKTDGSKIIIISNGCN
jgi:transmembrane sensor